MFFRTYIAENYDTIHDNLRARFPKEVHSSKQDFINNFMNECSTAFDQTFLPLFQAKYTAFSWGAKPVRGTNIPDIKQAMDMPELMGKETYLAVLEAEHQAVADLLMKSLVPTTKAFLIEDWRDRAEAHIAADPAIADQYEVSDEILSEHFEREAAILAHRLMGRMIYDGWVQAIQHDIIEPYNEWLDDETPDTISALITRLDNRRKPQALSDFVQDNPVVLETAEFFGMDIIPLLQLTRHQLDEGMLSDPDKGQPPFPRMAFGESLNSRPSGREFDAESIPTRMHGFNIRMDAIEIRLDELAKNESMATPHNKTLSCM